VIVPIQITFRHVARTEEIEEEIRSRARKLETFYSPITSCRVLVEVPPRRSLETPSPFHVRIELTVPGGEIVVKRAPALYPKERSTGAKHLNVAIHEAFDTARRRLQEHARQKRAAAKAHLAMPEGRVAKLFPEGYGYIETPDGREIYFHANSVLNDRFKRLKVDSKVCYTEEAGEKGPQAAMVSIVAKTRAASPSRGTRATRRKAS